MFTIGQFSRITGLTIKTLRLYHEKELLVPRRVDPANNYRYYDDQNVEQARIIGLLRSLDFSLDDIKTNINRLETDGAILPFLEKQRSEITARLQQIRRNARALDAIIQSEKEALTMIQSGKFDLKMISLAPLTIAGHRWQGRYDQTGKAIAQLAKKVGRYAAGPPFNLYYDDEYKEDGADIESCFPVHPGKIKATQDITVRALTGGRCVSFVHRGPYAQIGRSYARVLDHIQQMHWSMVLPIREIYLKGPGMIFKGNPKNYLTEIQITVSEKQEENHEAQL